MENKEQYIPGVCNIGPQEINQRRRVGWIGLSVTVILFFILKVLPVSLWWRLFLFFPAMLAATGFLQAHFHFCVGFARRGIFNFGEVGKTHVIINNTAQIKDRLRAKKINILALSIGIIVALISQYL